VCMSRLMSGRPIPICVGYTVNTRSLFLMPIEHACRRYGPDVYRLSLDLVARGAVNLK
jgi:hypothetical protein